MQKNPFKEKKILILLHPKWFDGSTYKWSNFMERNFGIVSTRGGLEENIDLGICWGSGHNLYEQFLRKNIPYLLVENDVYSLRCGLNEKTYSHDREKIENAVAVIFTSEDHAEYYEGLKKKYNWHIPEYVVIHNKPLKKDMNFISREKLKGLNLVYAGGLIPSRSLDLKQGNNFYYKCHQQTLEKFIEAGWNVHIYPTKVARTNYFIKYKNMGCIIHEWAHGGIIYKEMSQYTAGLQSFNKIGTPIQAFQYSQLCRPNKLYDYLASGIPTIGYQGGNGMEVYWDKWGIVIDDLEPETLKAIPERLKKIKITKKMRNDNVLDKERDKFEYIINVALKEAENKYRKKYYIAEIKNPFEKKFPIKITVENKTPSPITRINRIFLPKSISEVFSVDKTDYKQLRAHINLIIKEVEV